MKADRRSTAAGSPSPTTPPPQCHPLRRRAPLRRSPVGLVLWLALFLAPVHPAFADGYLELRIADPGPLTTRASAELVSSDGDRQRASDDDGDGFLVIVPELGAGGYELRVEVEGREATTQVEVPADGYVVVVYDRTADSPFRISVRERASFDSEIVVTARKREESLQEVPISITALSGDELEARSMRDLTEVADFTPNLDFSVSGGAGGSPSEATVYIRGVGQIETGIFADPGVGIYVDGVYVARAQGAVFDLLGLERVEVLRGPQGTLFGKNTTGGAIQLITRRPGPELEGHASVRAGNLDRLDVEGRVAGPLGDRLFGSLSALTTSRDGYVRSLATGEVLNDDDRDVARGALRWLATDRVTVDFLTDATRERESSLDQGLVALFGGPVGDFYNRVVGDFGFPTLDDSFITGDLTTSFSTFPSRNDGDVFSSTLRVSWAGAATNLLSITNYREYEYQGSSDLDGTPIRFFDRTFRQEQEQVSQELQLSGLAFDDRLEWLVGGLYFQEDPRDRSVAFAFENLFQALEMAPGPIYSPPGAPPELCDPGPPPPEVVCFGGAGNPANLFWFNGDGAFDDLRIKTTSYAAFGEGTLAVGDRLSLTAGLRYTYDEKDFRFFTDPMSSPARTITDRESWDQWSPRLSLSFQVRDNLLLYLSASQGFKSGGFNATRSMTRESLPPYDPETLWAYEGGFKTELAGNRLRLNGSAFYYDYDDIQFAAFLVVDGELLFAIQNAATARIQGFELELEALPFPGFLVSGSLGYVDSEYTDLRAQGNATLDGEVPKTPDWTGTVSLQYAFQLADAGSMIVRGDYSYRGAYFNDVANTPFIEQEAFGLVNARIVYAFPSDRWELALFGTNLTDELYLEHGFAAANAGVAVGIAARPREWGLSAQVRF